VVAATIKMPVWPATMSRPDSGANMRWRAFKIDDATGRAIRSKAPRGQLLSKGIPIFRILVAGILRALIVCSDALAADLKRVLVLHSLGRDFKPWSEYTKTTRLELDRQSPRPLEVIDQSLVTARAADENPEVPFVEYLRAIFAKRPIDLIVSIGALQRASCNGTANHSSPRLRWSSQR